MLEDKFYKRGLFLIFGLGVILRVLLFFINPSLFADESALVINIYNKSFFELFGALDFLQASPVGFTIIVKSLISIFNPQSDYLRDLVLRIVPFISGMLALPAFYYLVRLIFKENRKAVLTSLFFLFFNPCVIYYCAQIKQYSTEMLVSIILLTFFYKMVCNKEYKWWYALIFAISPWFSYSSFFILAVGFLAVLISDRKLFIKSVIPVFLSCLIYYFVSLRFVFAETFLQMRAVWEVNLGFIDLHHPLRTLLRYGDSFANSKPISALSGFIFFAICLIYSFGREKYSKKLLFVLPIFLTLFASLLHKYAIQARLILFLMPLFAIAAASIRGRIADILKLVLALIMLYSIHSYDVEPSGNCYSYAREIVSYLEENIKDKDMILMDTTVNDYNMYLSKRNFNNKVVYLPVACFKKDLAECKQFIRELPEGDYYLLSLSYYVKELTEGFNTKDFEVGFKPKRTKVIYFEKR